MSSSNPLQTPTNTKLIDTENKTDPLKNDLKKLYNSKILSIINKNKIQFN